MKIKENQTIEILGCEKCGHKNHIRRTYRKDGTIFFERLRETDKVKA